MALQNIRDKSQGTIAKVIVGLIAIPFVVFGVEQLFQGGGKSSVAEVDGVEISEAALMRAVYQQKSRLMAQMGDKVDPAAVDENALRQPTLEQLIDRTVLLNFAAAEKMVVGDRYAEQMIVGTEDFQEDGKFSAQRYSAILASNGWTPAEYKKQLKDQMLISQVVGGLAGSAFTTEEELAQFSRVVNEHRSFSYLTLPFAEASKSVSVTEEQIKAHYDARPDDFMTPEMVGVELVELRREAFEEAVPDEALRKQYDEEVAELAKKKERHAAHIFLPAKDAKAVEAASSALLQIKARIDKGEDFAAVAKAESKDRGSAAKGGDLGFTAGDSFPAEFEAALQSLAVGQVSAPVRTSTGVHLIKLLEEKGVDVPTFEASRERIRKDIAGRNADPRFVAAQEKLADASFNASDLKSVAQQLNLQVQTVAPFSRAGGDGLAAQPKVIDAAFSDDVLKAGNNSEVIELGKGHAVVLRVVEHKEPQRKSLAEVHDEIKATLLAEAAHKALADRADGMVKAVLAGQPLDVVSGKQPWQVVASVARAGDGKLDNALIDRAFKLNVENAKPGAGSVFLPNGDVAVVVVNKVEAGDPAKLSDAERKGMEGYLQRIIGTNAFAQLRAGLMAGAEIKRH